MDLKITHINKTVEKNVKRNKRINHNETYTFRSGTE